MLPTVNFRFFTITVVRIIVVRNNKNKNKQGVSAE